MQKRYNKDEEQDDGPESGRKMTTKGLETNHRTRLHKNYKATKPTTKFYKTDTLTQNHCKERIKGQQTYTESLQRQ